MHKKIIINGEEIEPGTSTKIDVNIARLPSHSSIDIPISIRRAKSDGPVMLLMGGLHGDEINGIEIVRRFILNEDFDLTKGTLICIPVLNIYGFINFSREVPDGKDINRSFPGNKTGSLASRVAYYLMKDIIPQIDYGLDFHTGGASRTNYPQIRCVYTNLNKELADAFNAPFTLHSKYRYKSLRQVAAKRGKHILVYEGGESMRFDEHAIQHGLDGTLRLMQHLDMVEEAPEADHQNQVIKNSSWVRARQSGLFNSHVEAGSKIFRGQVAGIITDTFGEYNIKVKSPANGYVIGLNNNPVVHQGDAILHIGRVKL